MNQDSLGAQIATHANLWYKIALADGTELGLGDAIAGTAGSGGSLVKVVPAGQGMVFRYQRVDGQDIPQQGWPQADKGWLRGIQVKSDGTEVIKNMSLSGDPAHLCMYNSNNNYGFITYDLGGNRVALYAYNRHGKVCGLRVTPAGEIIGHEGKFPLGLDCSFVQVGGLQTGYF